MKLFFLNPEGEIVCQFLEVQSKTEKQYTINHPVIKKINQSDISPKGNVMRMIASDEIGFTEEFTKIFPKWPVLINIDGSMQEGFAKYVLWLEKDKVLSINDIQQKLQKAQETLNGLRSQKEFADQITQVWKSKPAPTLPTS